MTSSPIGPRGRSGSDETPDEEGGAAEYAGLTPATSQS